jgi:hypothetical protein
MPQTICEVTPPGCSISSITDPANAYADFNRPSYFGPWLLNFLKPTGSDTIGGPACTTSGGAALPPATAEAWLLRQMWVLLKGRCYDPWMLWVATALARAGEDQMACEAAAQGLLPSACDFWAMPWVTCLAQACLSELLPLLETCGESGSWTNALTTQGAPACLAQGQYIRSSCVHGLMLRV